MRATPEEKADLERQAKAAGLTVSEFLREQVWPPAVIQPRITDGRPDGADEAEYSERVKRLRSQGMPEKASIRLARLQAMGLRPDDDHSPRPKMTEAQRAQVAERAAQIHRERGIHLRYASGLARQELGV